MPTFAYETAPINEFKVAETDAKGKVKFMRIGDRLVTPTERFWTSLCANFSTIGLSTKLFKMFSHAEVFERLTMKGNDRIGYTLAEFDGKKSAKLLAITKPNKPVARYDEVIDMLGNFDAQDVKYLDNNKSSTGIVQSWHTPPRMDMFDVGGDKFMPKYVMETPIDGFGKPLIYLSLIRQTCTNGAIGYSRAFRSELSIGKGKDADVMHSLERALDSYSNEEGYMALRQRLESATTSWASVGEAHNIMKNLAKMTGDFQQKGAGTENIESRGKLAMQALGGDGLSADQHLSFKIQKAFTNLTGDLCHLYGIAQLDALSRKKMASLPTRATVYDVFNFMTEVATHYTNENGARRAQSIVGGMLGNGEFDLEGTMTEGNMPEFADWQIANSDEAKELKAGREAISNN